MVKIDNADGVIERNDRGVCPICKKSAKGMLPKDLKFVKYKGFTVMVCAGHSGV